MGAGGTNSEPITQESKDAIAEFQAKLEEIRDSHPLEVISLGLSKSNAKTQISSRCVETLLGGETS